MEGEEEIKLTEKQEQFILEYLIDLNATQAAIRAGYSEKTAYSIGWENLRKPEIRQSIDNHLKERAVSSDETIKIISDIAKGSLNDYMKVVKTMRRRNVQKPLQKKIDELRWDIEKRKEVADRVGYDEKRNDALFALINSIEEEIIGYEIELEKNPDACIFELGEPELEETVEVDMAKLARDKECGRVKTLQWGEFGPKVELYGADSALTNLAKMHGLFEKDNQQKKSDINLSQSDEQFNKLLQAAREGIKTDKGE